MRFVKTIFGDVYDWAGKYKIININKCEPLLVGKSVWYSNWDCIDKNLNAVYDRINHVDWNNLSHDEFAKSIAHLFPAIWQIHPFREGNTRTTAVFAIKYLRSLGFEVTNTLFADNSWYFRNALVRANYADIQNGVYEDKSYFEKFFRNLILDEKNEMKNRYLLIGADLSTTEKIVDNKEIGDKSKNEAVYS